MPVQGDTIVHHGFRQRVDGAAQPMRFTSALRYALKAYAEIQLRITADPPPSIAIA
jgi:hypothetical protein